MKFSKGDLRYTSQFKYIAVEFQGLQNIKPTLSAIREIDYSILISNDSSQLEALSNCDNSDKMNLIVIPLGKRSNPSKSSDKTYYKHEVEVKFVLCRKHIWKSTSWPIPISIFQLWPSLRLKWQTGLRKA